VFIYVCTYLETKPFISIHPSSKEVTLTSECDTQHLKLTCQAIGATSYSWERWDDSIPPGAIGVNSNTLTLVNPTPEDVGHYQCVVSDGNEKNFSNYAKVTVHG